MTWTDDRTTTLTQCWRDGLSASQIAQRLGGVTRNAVIGKVHRLGLDGRATTSRRAAPRRSRSNLRVPRTPGRIFHHKRAKPIRQNRLVAGPKRLATPPELGPAPSIPVTVETLTSLTCRWPQGDPKASDFHFCGRGKSRADLPYCDHHTAIASN
jgi:GcrA cell cycle regulator